METLRPKCPVTIRVNGTARYEFDGSNMFLLDERSIPFAPQPSHEIDDENTPWLATVRTDPPQTPLGWSRYIGRAVFWLGEDLVFPGEIASWILWRHRDASTIWHTGKPHNDKGITPTTVWAGPNTSDPPLAYIMPFRPDAYPRWSELRHHTRGNRRL